MTTLDFSRLTGESRPHQVHGWMVSLLCHVLVVGCAIALMAEIEKPVLPDTFQWEVSVVESPASVEAAPLEKPPAKPVVQPPPSPVKPIRQPVQHTVQDVAVPVETVQAVQQTTQEAVTQIVSSRQDPMMEHTPPQPTAVSPVERAEPIHERTEEVVQAASSMIEHRAVQERLVQYRQTQADYGWLRDALWRRIEDLKRYPTQARANHWEGRVVVKAVIRDDGTVADLMIAESSGQSILDQEALAVMMKASPLILKHPLGKPSITMLIPISYRLDG
ncbi:MAG: energy transducer TonB [Nitrospirota bacterium]